MIKPEQIPDEVVEAAAKALHAAWIDNNAGPDDRHEYREWKFLTNDERSDLIHEARAAIAAALNAWPGATTTSWFQDAKFMAQLNLPLPEAPQERGDSTESGDE